MVSIFPLNLNVKGLNLYFAIYLPSVRLGSLGSLGLGV